MERRLTPEHQPAIIFGFTELSFISLILVGAGVTFLSGGSMHALLAPSAFVAASLLSVLFFGWRRCVWPVGSALVFNVVSTFLCGFVYDSSYDSISYHYDTVIMLAEGWRPFSETIGSGNIWGQHYAKALEIIQSSILCVTGNLQTVKSSNLILTAAALCIAWHALKIASPGIKRKWRLALVAMLAMNPVLVSQLMSGYNDYALWVETILAISSFALCRKSPSDKLPYLILFMTVVLAANTKFTHFFYIGVECLFFAVWCLVDKEYGIVKKGVISTIAGVIVGVGVVGFNPYVRNVAEHSNPVYPLGTDQVDIMTSNTPEMFLDNDRFTNFVISLASTADARWSLLNGSMTPGGLGKCYAYDARINGFGVFMSVLLLMGFAAMVLSKASIRWWMVYAASILLCFCFEQSWWARYIPFLWIAIVLPFILLLNAKPVTRSGRLLFKCAFICIAVNASISLASTVYTRASYSVYLSYIFNRQKQSGKPLKTVLLNNTFRQQFKEQGVEITEYDSLDSVSADRKEMFNLYGYGFYEGYVELPEADFPEVYHRPESAFALLTQYDKRRFSTHQRDN